MCDNAQYVPKDTGPHVKVESPKWTSDIFFAQRSSLCQVCLLDLSPFVICTGVYGRGMIHVHLETVGNGAQKTLYLFYLSLRKCVAFKASTLRTNPSVMSNRHNFA